MAAKTPDLFKFCLGCGNKLPHMPAMEREESAEFAMVQDESTAGGTETEEAVPCPKCGAPNLPAHRFCATCGHNMADGTPNPHLGGGAARLVALNPDGSEGVAIPVEGTTTVGRATGGLFAQDQYLSPQHATFTTTGEQVLVKDEASLNGVFRRLPADQRVALAPGQLFRIGQELIRFEVLHSKPPDADGVECMGAPVEGYVGRIAMVLGRESTGTAFPIPETGLNLGRERGEVLFADDGYVSGLHCRLSFDEGQVFLTDLGSSNGTFVEVQQAEPFRNGEVLLMGQQLFRIVC